MTAEQILKIVGELEFLRDAYPDTRLNISITPYAPEKDGKQKYAFEAEKTDEDFKIMDEVI